MNKREATQPDTEKCDQTGGEREATGRQNSTPVIERKERGKERRIPNSAVIKSLPSQQNGVL